MYVTVIRDPLVSVITLTNKSIYRYLISYVRQTVSETTHLSPKDENLYKDHLIVSRIATNHRKWMCRQSAGYGQWKRWDCQQHVADGAPTSDCLHIEVSLAVTLWAVKHATTSRRASSGLLVVCRLESHCPLHSPVNDCRWHVQQCTMHI